eukprot:g43484.t1
MNIAPTPAPAGFWKTWERPGPGAYRHAFCKREDSAEEGKRRKEDKEEEDEEARRVEEEKEEKEGAGRMPQKHYH